MKRLARGVLSLVFVAGVVLAVWPLGQTAYGLLSQRALWATWRRAAAGDIARRAAHSSAAHRHRVVTRVAPVTASNEPSVSAASEAAPPDPQDSGWRPTRIIIPSISLDAIVVQGWDGGDLRQGPGHYPGSALPGQPGNCVIAGHRNVYGRWFYRLDELWAGSIIRLQTPRDSFTYRVVLVRSVSDSDVTILQSPAGTAARPHLTLITCTLPHSAQRVVVDAELSPDALD